jgi:hypothetical protein
MLHQFWRLSECGDDNLGLAVTADALVLGRTPLIERHDGHFVVRDRREIERLLGCAYRAEAAADRLMPGLAAVAAALNADDQCLARIAAVHLRIPDLPNKAARDDMEAQDVLLKSVDWNPDLHPRTGTPPNPGWFALTGGAGDESSSTRTAQNDDPTRRSDASPSAADDRVRLPPGPQRIDELADFVEWMANAKPEDEQAIRAEIKRYFYDAGDQGSAAALNSALTVLLRPGISREDRQKILDRLDVFTRADPAEYAQTREWATGAAVAASVLPGAAGEAAAATPSGASEAWKYGWARRGQYFDNLLRDGSLPPGFRTIDNFTNGVATSIKSIDLNAATYQDGARLTNRLNKYIDDISEYEGGSYANKTVPLEEITDREVSLAVPKGSMTEMQRIAIDAVRARAKMLNKPVEITITEF